MALLVAAYSLQVSVELVSTHERTYKGQDHKIASLPHTTSLYDRRPSAILLRVANLVASVLINLLVQMEL